LRKRKVISNTKIKNNFLKEKNSLVFKYQKSLNEIPSSNVEKRSFAETKYFHLFSSLLGVVGVGEPYQETLCKYLFSKVVVHMNVNRRFM
jgi:hypothetical protein